MFKLLINSRNILKYFHEYTVVYVGYFKNILVVFFYMSNIKGKTLPSQEIKLRHVSGPNKVLYIGMKTNVVTNPFNRNMKITRIIYNFK
uniref:Uncharacterized protein n=1 Tax=Lepeophtheirus salmonis TaxID=72036 RepID=A0A0K2T0K6_LEPSM